MNFFLFKRMRLKVFLLKILWQWNKGSLSYMHFLIIFRTPHVSLSCKSSLSSSSSSSSLLLLLWTFVFSSLLFHITGSFLIMFQIKINNWWWWRILASHSVVNIWTSGSIYRFIFSSSSASDSLSSLPSSFASLFG